jgi:hypothetical protein
MSPMATSPITTPGAPSRRGAAGASRVEPDQDAEIRRLRAALAASTCEIVALRRRLASVRAENAALRGATASAPDDPRHIRMRTMLLDPHSRNP